MSEHDGASFLGAEGVEDWVVFTAVQRLCSGCGQWVIRSYWPSRWSMYSETSQEFC